MWNWLQRDQPEVELAEKPAQSKKKEHEYASNGERKNISMQQNLSCLIVHSLLLHENGIKITHKPLM